MPMYQAIAERLNSQFNRENIGRMGKKQFAPGELIDVFQQMGLIHNEEQAEFVRSMPMALRETLRAVYNSAINREHQIPVTIAWLPGYDWEITVAEAPGVPGSIGGITIIVRTRYPADRHPAAGTGQSAS